MVRVCTHGNSSSATLGDFKQTYVQVLPIGVSVDLHCFIEPGRLVKDRFPVRAQTETIIVNPAARVAENLNVRIAKSSEITFGLVFFAPQRGKEPRTISSERKAAGSISPSPKRLRFISMECKTVSLPMLARSSRLTASISTDCFFSFASLIPFAIDKPLEWSVIAMNS